MGRSELIIFEGPDGGGKTTMAQRYAYETGARYVHLGPLPRVTERGLARIYLEVMMPALLGIQSVVMDRAWHSEVPYGTVFRKGFDRMGQGNYRMVERVAHRCNPLVVFCDPPFSVMKKTFEGRKEDEYLQKVEQLDLVKRMYQQEWSCTSLPYLLWDYTNDLESDLYQAIHRHFAETKEPRYHPIEQSAGNLHAKVLLVGDQFTDLTDHDSINQFPFVHFSKAGCCHWLAMELARAGVSESELCWVNSDQDFMAVGAAMPNLEHMVALGGHAAEALRRAGIAIFTTFDHPQHHKRFKSSEEYPLLNFLSRNV